MSCLPSFLASLAVFDATCLGVTFFCKCENAVDAINIKMKTYERYRSFLSRLSAKDAGVRANDASCLYAVT